VDIRRVRFRASGGFAGLIRGTEIDGSELSDSEHSALERQVTHGQVARHQEARDLLTYELDVETGGGTRHLEFDESSTPDELTELVKRLSQRSRPVAP
jgi:hypothetical protein